MQFNLVSSQVASCLREMKVVVSGGSCQMSEDNLPLPTNSTQLSLLSDKSDMKETGSLSIAPDFCLESSPKMLSSAYRQNETIRQSESVIIGGLESGYKCDVRNAPWTFVLKYSQSHKRWKLCRNTNILILNCFKCSEIIKTSHVCVGYLIPQRDTSLPLK